MKIKKLAATLLAVIMMLSLGSITVFADGEDIIAVYLKDTWGDDNESVITRVYSINGDLSWDKCGKLDGTTLYRIEVPSGVKSVYIKHSINGNAFLYTISTDGQNLYETTTLGNWQAIGTYDKETLTEDDLESTKNITATYYAGVDGGTIYSVDVAWGAMEFTYQDPGAGIWNPEDHSVDYAEGTGWTAEGNTVKVTNHSNAAVNVDFSYSPATGFESVTGAFDITSQKLNAGVENDYDNAASVTARLELSGSFTGADANEYTVGTATVTIS